MTETPTMKIVRRVMDEEFSTLGIDPLNPTPDEPTVYKFMGLVPHPVALPARAVAWGEVQRRTGLPAGRCLALSVDD